MIRWTIQRIFSMTVLTTYSPSLSAQLCEVIGIDLPSTKEFYYITCPPEIRFTYTYVACVITRAGHHLKGVTIRARYKLCTKSYTRCRSNSFPNPVVAKWKKESRTLQTKAIKEVTVSGKKVGQLNLTRPMFWDSISASTYGGEVLLQPRTC